MAHVAAWKKQVVKELVDAMRSHHSVAVVDLHGIPSAQLQLMRQGMRPKAALIMSRNTLLDIAIDEAAKERPGLEKIKEFLGGQSAIVATDENPFRLFRNMEATKSAAPAKPGDIAPDDIEVKAGDTPFKPGPIVGELQKVGIPAGIEGGKIVIKKDKVLVKKGDVISPELAVILPKLEILPMTVGMDLRAVFEDGLIYKKEVLDIPADYYVGLMAQASRNAMALAVEVAYFAPETMSPLLAKAYRSAVAVSSEAAFPTKDTVQFLLAKAEASMLALAARVPELADERVKARLSAKPSSPAPSSSKKEEPKEEKKEEKVSEEDAAAGLGALFG
ncbi:MAG TPA: 50S ribosomal protein L10 [Methanomassiliicoccales archaeon]|nr:50S ribosomal protein L10 [Methanomassiliicoccales archaeon]